MNPNRMLPAAQSRPARLEEHPPKRISLAELRSPSGPAIVVSVWPHLQQACVGRSASLALCRLQRRRRAAEALCQRLPCQRLRAVTHLGPGLAPTIGKARTCESGAEEREFGGRGLAGAAARLGQRSPAWCLARMLTRGAGATSTPSACTDGCAVALGVVLSGLPPEEVPSIAGGCPAGPFVLCHWRLLSPSC